MFSILYRDGRHEPREWRADYEAKDEAMRQAAFDLERGEVVEVQDGDGKKVAGKDELQKYAKRCLDEGLPAFVRREELNRKVT